MPMPLWSLRISGRLDLPDSPTLGQKGPRSQESRNMHPEGRPPLARAHQRHPSNRAAGDDDDGPSEWSSDSSSTSVRKGDTLDEQIGRAHV